MLDVPARSFTRDSCVYWAGMEFVNLPAQDQKSVLQELDLAKLCIRGNGEKYATDFVIRQAEVATGPENYDKSDLIEAFVEGLTWRERYRDENPRKSEICLECNHRLTCYAGELKDFRVIAH